MASAQLKITPNDKTSNRLSLLSVCLSFLLLIGICLASIQYRALTLPMTHSSALVPTDAVIVTTGGQARISAGLTLMQDGYAKHMLVTGVGVGITKSILADSLGLSDPQKEQLICCVDLDFTATDTIENAKATASWMRQHNYTSLRLVTANYHLARARLEFAHAMPKIKIEHFAVSPPDLQPQNWFYDWTITRLLVRESGKYIAAHLRHLFSRSKAAA